MEVAYVNIHQEIVDRCKKGDRKAFKELYNLYAKAMYNVTYRITNDQYEAEDVLQEAFVSAFKNITSFRSESSFGAWLKKIVVNRAVNQMKKKRLEVTSIDEKPGLLANSPTESSVDNFYQQLNVEKVKKALLLLPDGYRMVFSLYLLEGYDHAEIAQIMNITVSTSKSQYNRAKKKLKLILEEI